MALKCFFRLLIVYLISSSEIASQDAINGGISFSSLLLWYEIFLNVVCLISHEKDLHIFVFVVLRVIKYYFFFILYAGV